VVAGGGTALLVAGLKVLTGPKGEPTPNSVINTGRRVGHEIVKFALPVPAMQIIANGGLPGPMIVTQIVKKMKGESDVISSENTSVVVNEPEDIKFPNVGFDAMNNQIVDDMFEAGIVDPAKVTKSVLQNAASIASMVLTSAVAISDKPEEKKDSAPGGMPGMGGMGGGMGMDY